MNYLVRSEISYIEHGQIKGTSPHLMWPHAQQKIEFSTDIKVVPFVSIESQMDDVYRAGTAEGRDHLRNESDKAGSILIQKFASIRDDD